MPPLQVFTDVLRLDRPKKQIDHECFADTEMWKEVLSKREKFDISEADIFHFFSQKSLMPASALVGGNNPLVSNPFQVKTIIFYNSIQHYISLYPTIYENNSGKMTFFAFLGYD